MKKVIFLLSLFLILSHLPSNAIESLDDIQVGGIYRMELFADKVLEGIIEDKTDSSLIIECQGTPYSFNAHLIKSYTLIAPPRKKSADGSEVLSFEELLHNSGAARKVKISLSNGSVFKGNISAIDSETVSLDVGGSVIPISREIITRITTLVPETKKQEQLSKVQKPQKPQGPFDTVYVLNPKTDEYGRRLNPLMIIGQIQSDEADGLIIITPQGAKRKILRDRIVRIKQHTEDNFEQKIKTYAKSLFCPANMILVDLPPGKEGRPFFKVCIDKYEYPNQRDVTPKNNISFNDAQELCIKVGKRLCTVEEWQWSCSGLEGYTYSYGYRLEKVYCNREGNKNIEPSGNRYKCVGKFGVYDMVGNIFEWVSDAKGNPMLMGGPYSKCQTVSPGMKGQAKSSVGFRCCKSN